MHVKGPKRTSTSNKFLNPCTRNLVNTVIPRLRRFRSSSRYHDSYSRGHTSGFGACSLKPALTITDMYNVLEKLRRGEPLTDKDRRVHEQGLVSLLRQIHDDLDAAVAEAYGWPADLPDDEILRRLVALNAERAAEERRGIVRWLRPEFQNPGGAAAPAAGATGTQQGELALTQPAAATAAGAKQKPAWPKALPEQVAALRGALATRVAPASAEKLAREFRGARADRVAELLATLAMLGQARQAAPGRFAA